MGTLVVRLVELPLVVTARVAFSERRLFGRTVSKLLPLTVTDVPMTPMDGETLVIVGVAAADPI